MKEDKRKPLSQIVLADRDKGTSNRNRSYILLSILSQRGQKIMNKKKNLFILVFLIGSAATLLPTLGKILLFTTAAVYLFMVFDEWDYNKRNGDAK
ncbi:hypothetical protein JZO70_10200 [Enterococcus sp. 669A]|uniref:Uncharacterized protein n=1 Tax=Candidatus Enterococcus moelleringii TaxID=2815325 RepID=A0ABS3LA79_9ENTE|nr:hypothetical protein [Enterococcus sp. 669A]MBO1306535.1 hypothetical protein [Enterococcus sp. 669A]